MITLEPGTLFTVAQYPHTTFESGTDLAYRRERGAGPGPWMAEPGTPWAFPHAAVIAARELQFARPKPQYALSFGDVVYIPEYGQYSVERDHNRNVKFVAVASCDCRGSYTNGTNHTDRCLTKQSVARQDETGA